MRFSQENGHSRRAQSPQAPPPCRTPSAHSLRFNKASKLLKRKQFQAVMKKGRRFFGQVIVIASCSSDLPRLGITVPRKYGNAVQRNRFKRLVREAFRLNQHLFSSCDLIISPKNGLESISLETIAFDLHSFTRNCHLRA